MYYTKLRACSHFHPLLHPTTPKSCHVTVPLPYKQSDPTRPRRDSDHINGNPFSSCFEQPPASLPPSVSPNRLAVSQPKQQQPTPPTHTSQHSWKLLTQVTRTRETKTKPSAPKKATRTQTAQESQSFIVISIVNRQTDQPDSNPTTMEGWSPANSFPFSVPHSRPQTDNQSHTSIVNLHRQPKDCSLILLLSLPLPLHQGK